MALLFYCRYHKLLECDQEKPESSMSEQSPNRLHQWLETSRLRLARPDALLQLAGLGIAAGVLSGLVIVAFRLLVEESAASWLPGGSDENFEPT